MSDLPVQKPITQSIPVAQPPTSAAVSEMKIPENLKEIEKLMVAAARNKASDLHLKVGQKPILRVNTVIHEVGNRVLQGDDVKTLIYSIMSEIQRDRYETEHDLDRVIEADGRVYGVEVKNTLKYIPKAELEIKLAMCRFFGILPLLIMRFSPKVYNFEVAKTGGFALLFKDQLYPFGQDAFAARVRKELGLPVHCPPSVPEGVLVRFRNWHAKQVGKSPN